MKEESWGVNRNLGIGVVISAIFYGVWIVTWANSLSHRIQAVAVSVDRLDIKIGEHRGVSAHGDVNAGMASLEARISAIEKWQQMGERFTATEGRALETRIRRIEMISWPERISP